jgi:carboxypeptidase family protein
MRRIQRLELAFVLFAVLAALPTGAYAQSFNGNIIGTVKDSSGAVMPGVTLTLRNVNTDQIVQTTVSGDDGAYAFRNLQPSKYEVQATMDGFRPFSNSNIDVTLSSTQRVDIGLEVGGHRGELGPGQHRHAGARHQP